MSEEFQIIGTDADLEKMNQYEEGIAKYKQECVTSNIYKKNVEKLTKQVSFLKLKLNQMRIEKEELRDYHAVIVSDLKRTTTPTFIKPIKLYHVNKSMQPTPIFKKKQAIAPTIHIQPMPLPPKINIISRDTTHIEPISNPINDSIYRKTADICKCFECLNHHRYADGYCNIHRYMRLNLV